VQVVCVEHHGVKVRDYQIPSQGTANYLERAFRYRFPCDKVTRCGCELGSLGLRGHLLDEECAGIPLRMVIVYKDVISGDEMISDSYEPVKIYNDACFEVKAKMVKKGNV